MTEKDVFMDADRDVIISNEDSLFSMENAATVDGKQELTEIISKAIAGDSHAFETLYKRYVSDILWHTKNLLNEKEEVFDVAQEAVLKLYQKIGTLRSPYAFYSYMLSTIRNTCVSHNVKSGRRRSENIDDYAEELSDSGATPDITLENAEVAAEIRIAMERLPKKQKTALFLCYYKDMSYKEIASAMGISGQAVGVNITRAKKALKNMIENKAKDIAKNEDSTLKGLAFGPAVSQAFKFEINTTFTAAKVKNFTSICDTQILAGAKAMGSSMGTGIGGAFAGVSKAFIASVTAIAVTAGGAAFAIHTYTQSVPEPITHDWLPETSIALESEEGKAGQEDPYRASLIIEGAEELSWSIVSGAGEVISSGAGGEISAELTALPPGDYTIEWTAKNPEGKIVIVSRDIVVSDPAD